ncbi:MAG: hypothetical protein AB1668_07035 [Nanoarchaeota archaeon]
MSNPLENLLDVKGIIGTIAFVFVVIAVLLLINGLRESPLGQNEQSKQVLDNAESSINILTNGYFLAGSIAGLIGLIAFFVWLFRKFESGGGII